MSKTIMKEEIIAILEEHLFVSDEWGGAKLANWQWGSNVVVDGLDEVADAILEWKHMQFTDRKDKHGIDIYEGNTIEQEFSKDVKDLWDVVYDDGQYFLQNYTRMIALDQIASEDIAVVPWTDGKEDDVK